VKSMKRQHITYAAIGVVVLLLMLLRVRFVTTLAISFAAGFVQFFASKYNHVLKIDLGHIFFIGVLLSQTAGGVTAAAFVFLAGIIPKLMGGDIDPVILIAYAIQAVIVFIAQFFQLPIIAYGVILSLITFTIILIVTVVIDFQLIEVLDDSVAPFIINAMLFFSVGEPLLLLFQNLY